MQGTLKGYDQLMNLVLDDVDEMLRGELFYAFPHSAKSVPFTTTAKLTTLDENDNPSTRPLGLLVARGTLLTSISPADGSEEISNPFLGGGDGADGMEDGEGGVVMES